MTRMLRTALLATVLMAVAAPTALADSSKWERSRTLTCGEASLKVLLPPSEFAPAIVPFHVRDSTAVLIPFWLRVTSTDPQHLWVWDARSKPFVAQHADRLISCEYTDEDGLFIEIVGMLTPAS
jgi:hypothetical protein